MRLSQLFGKTLRQVPTEAETPSHVLLLRAGMAAQIAAGVWAYLPLGMRVLQRIEGIIREEMDAEGGQEMLLPSMVPIELYEQSGRDVTMGDILYRFKDHRDRDFALGPTHEEAFVEVFKRNVRSYRDMPLLVYQIAAKFRDEPRPRGGLIRLRQFIMKDLYSFDVDYAGLDVSYEKMYGAYKRIFDRCGVPTVPVLADVGMMGGRDTHQFTYLTEYGEDTCLLCPKCGYAADSEVAAFVKEPAHADEEMLPLEEIDTPGQKTIADLASFLGVPETRACKAVFYVATLRGGDGQSAIGNGQLGGQRGDGQSAIGNGQLGGQRGDGQLEIGNRKSGMVREPAQTGGLVRQPIFVAIRGDMDVNEAKLRNALGAVELEYMDEEAVKRAGFVAGSAGAVGLRDAISNGQLEIGQGVRIVADELVTRERNLVAGANKAEKHLLNTNYGRDWTADVVADIALAKAGYRCANCGTAMEARNGIEMGQVFKLGTHYSEKMGAYFLDAEGKQQPAVMGSYGIGIERLLAAAIEANHDEAGIVWPRSLAPFDVHIVAIQAEKPEVREPAERLYEELQSAGLSVLYDDREETPGVKFNDADLLGMPLRVTVSPRNLANGQLEVKGRTEKESRLVGLEEAVELLVASC